MKKTIAIDVADNAARDRKIQQQQAENQKLKLQLAELSGRIKGDSQSKDSELLGDFHEPISRMIESAIGGVSEQIESSLNQKMDGLTTSIDNLKDSMGGHSKKLLDGVASTTLGSNYSEIVKSGDFKTFLADKIVGAKATYEDSWADAKLNGDLETMKEILQLFMGTEKGAQFSNSDNEPSNEDMENLNNDEQEVSDEVNVEPKGTAGANTNTSSKFKYKASQLAEKTEAYNSNQITEEELETFEKSFYEAVDSGQVENDLKQTD